MGNQTGKITLTASQFAPRPTLNETLGVLKEVCVSLECPQKQVQIHTARTTELPLPLGERCRPRPPRPPLIPPRPPLPPLTGDIFSGMPPALNLLVGDLAGLVLTAVGEAASGDVGDLSDPASLLEFSAAPSAPSRFKGTHF